MCVDVSCMCVCVSVCACVCDSPGVCEGSAGFRAGGVGGRELGSSFIMYQGECS